MRQAISARRTPVRCTRRRGVHQLAQFESDRHDNRGQLTGDSYSVSGGGATGMQAYLGEHITIHRAAGTQAKNLLGLFAELSRRTRFPRC